MDTRWNKHNRKAEQEEEGAEHGAWWASWPAAQALLCYVVWAYVIIRSEFAVDEGSYVVCFWKVSVSTFLLKRAGRDVQ